MADAVTPQSKVDVDPNFERQLRNLQEWSAAAAEAMRLGNQVTWFRPVDWNGNVFDYEGMRGPFNRDIANQQFVDAVSDPQAPGVSGDLVAATLMVDYLSVMERAFRNRHTMTRARRVAHMAGRLAGQGSANGTFIQSGVEFVRRIVQRAKAQS